MNSLGFSGISDSGGRSGLADHDTVVLLHDIGAFGRS
jgi:hypothetical protein